MYIFKAQCILHSRTQKRLLYGEKGELKTLGLIVTAEYYFHEWFYTLTKSDCLKQRELSKHRS